MGSLVPGLTPSDVYVPSFPSPATHVMTSVQSCPLGLLLPSMPSSLRNARRAASQGSAPRRCLCVSPWPTSLGEGHPPTKQTHSLGQKTMTSPSRLACAAPGRQQMFGGTDDPASQGRGPSPAGSPAPRFVSAAHDLAPLWQAYYSLRSQGRWPPPPSATQSWSSLLLNPQRRANMPLGARHPVQRWGLSRHRTGTDTEPPRGAA